MLQVFSHNLFPTETVLVSLFFGAIKLMYLNIKCAWLCEQRPGNAQEEVARRCQTQAWKGKLRVLRTFEVAATSVGNNQPAGQSVHYSTFNQLSQTKDILIAVECRSPICSFSSQRRYELQLQLKLFSSYTLCT